MSYTVNSLEEMPNALSYLIKTVEELQSTVKAKPCSISRQVIHLNGWI